MNPDDAPTQDKTLQSILLVLDRLIREGKVVARLDSSVHQIFPVSIEPAEGEALRSWIAREKAVRTIEIGLAYGISTLFIGQGLLSSGGRNARHIAIDPYQSNFKNCGLQLLEEAGIADIVEHYPEESQIALPRFVNEGREFDFAFVDGSHLFDRVFLDLMYLGRLVRPGSIIFVDDYQSPAVARAVSFCLTNLGWKPEETGPQSALHQWVVLRTPREPLSRSYPHFVDF